MRDSYFARVFEHKNSDGTLDWICEYPDLPGCTGVGETREAALADGEIAKELWLEVYYEDHKSYPKASDALSREYSGRFMLRTSRRLHRELVVRAASEGVSLNHLCCELLSGGLEAKAAESPDTLVVSTVAKVNQTWKSASYGRWMSQTKGLSVVKRA